MFHGFLYHDSYKTSYQYPHFLISLPHPIMIPIKFVWIWRQHLEIFELRPHPSPVEALEAVVSWTAALLRLLTPSLPAVQSHIGSY